MPEIIYTPRLAQNAPFAYLGEPRGCQSVVLSVHMAKTRHSGRMFGRKTARKRPKLGSEDKNWPKQEIMHEIIYTPRLAQNTPFAQLGAPRGCQSVALSVHMAKTRHSGRMFGRKTARKRLNRDRIRISATGLLKIRVRPSYTSVRVACDGLASYLRTKFSIAGKFTSVHV
jgi:hypothetical protein